MRLIPALLVALIPLTGRAVANSQTSAAAVGIEFASTIIPIKYAKTEDVASALNSLSSDGDGDASRMLRFFKSLDIPADLPAFGKIAIAADVRGNCISVSASPSDRAKINRLLSKIDAALPQVLMEVLIIELPWPNRGLFKRNDTGRTPAEVLAEIGVTSGQVIAMTNFAPATATCAQSNQIQGFSYVERTDQGFDSILAAAASNGRIRLLQKPRIITANQTAAELFFGFVDQISYYPQGGPCGCHQQIRTGVGLSLTPAIHRDAFGELDIRQSLNEITGSIEITGVGEVPITTSSISSRATLPVREGETLVIGSFSHIVRHDWAEEAPVIRNLPKLKRLLPPVAYHTRGEVVVFLRLAVLPAADTVRLLQ